MKAFICGLGHATHALIPLMESRGIKVHVFSRRSHLPQAIEIRTGCGLVGRASLSTDPSKVQDYEYVVLPIPSDAFDPYLSMIGPYLKTGHHLVVTPGQGLFEEALKRHLHPGVEVKVSYVLPMPVNCRILVEGSSVDVKAYKRNFVFTGSSPAESSALAFLFDALKMDFVEGGAAYADLMPINPIIHPSRIFNLFKDREVIEQNPFFYEEMGPEDISLMDAMQDELQRISSAHGVKIPRVFDFLSKFVYETDYPDALSFFTQYSAYKGFRSPVKPVENGFSLDKSSRYLTEDIDFGLKVYQKYAGEKGIPTPTIDMVVDRLTSL